MRIASEFLLFPPGNGVVLVVRLEVSDEAAFLGETFLADRTRVGFVPGVSSHMNAKIFDGAKGLPAYVANVRFFAGVNPRVYTKIGLARDGFSANVTRVTFPRMNPGVNF